jgi:hypothetical protein
LGQVELAKLWRIAELQCPPAMKLLELMKAHDHVVCCHDFQKSLIIQVKRQSLLAWLITTRLIPFEVNTSATIERFLVNGCSSFTVGINLFIRSSCLNEACQSKHLFYLISLTEACWHNTRLLLNSFLNASETVGLHSPSCRMKNHFPRIGMMELHSHPAPSKPACVAAFR